MLKFWLFVTGISDVSRTPPPPIFDSKVIPSRDTMDLQEKRRETQISQNQEQKN